MPARHWVCSARVPDAYAAIDGVAQSAVNKIVDIRSGLTLGHPLPEARLPIFQSDFHQREF
jgi:hypothetical protein